MAHLLPLFAIGSDLHAQLIAFLNKLFQLGIHPGDLFFADRLDGDGLCLGPIIVVTEGHHTFLQRPDGPHRKDAVIEEFVEKRLNCFEVARTSS